MKDKNKRRLGGPKHISEIIKLAKQELSKNPDPVDPIRDMLNSDAELKNNNHIQTIFLYINGDPQYIRQIFLN